MHDYMKALYYRFQTPSDRTAKLEQALNKTHKRLAGQIAPPQRCLLLRLADLEYTLRDESCLESFMAGYRVAHGIHQELLADRPPYNFEDEEERLAWERFAKNTR